MPPESSVFEPAPRSEDVLDASSDALEDFAGSPGGAHRNVLACRSSALSHRSGGIYRMQCDEVGSTFPRTRGQVTCSFAGTLADIGAAAADVTTGAAPFLFRVHSCLRRGGRALI